MIRLVIVKIVFGLMLVAGCASAHPATCQEDEACWDCTSMGNRICGVIV